MRIGTTTSAVLEARVQPAAPRPDPERCGAGRFRVDLDGVGAVSFRARDQPGGRVDDRRRADGEEDLARGRVKAAGQDVRVDRFAEPDDARARGAATVGAGWRQRRERHAKILPGLAAGGAVGGAAQLPNRTVKPDHAARAGPLVQAVDILCDQRHAAAVGPPRQHLVRGIGDAARDQRRRQSYHSQTSRGSRSNASGVAEILRPERTPQSSGAAERRDAARRRNPGARHDRDRSCVADARAERFQPRRGVNGVGQRGVNLRARRAAESQRARPMISRKAPSNRVGLLLRSTPEGGERALAGPWGWLHNGDFTFANITSDDYTVQVSTDWFKILLERRSGDTGDQEIKRSGGCRLVS